MKKIVILIFVLISFSVCAQEQNMIDCFKQMPDSLMPYLSHNNRLDMVDFQEANMEARVSNQLNGSSVMTYMSEDSISLMLSESLCIYLSFETKDSTVICMKKVYKQKERPAEVIVDYYTTAWRPLYSIITQDVILKRDEDIFNNVHF